MIDPGDGIHDAAVRVVVLPEFPSSGTWRP
jgi:hypothetical protein